jgi:hypothetical protein
MGGNEAACRQDTFFYFHYTTLVLRNDQRELKGRDGRVADPEVDPGSIGSVDPDPGPGGQK